MTILCRGGNEMKDYSNYYPSFKDILMHNGEIMFNHQLEDFDSKDISIKIL